ncbi:MAG TPA: ABC transporter permease, partial [Solirubrobacteraceae bacterium]|nr:ABC transporter permease [Solirubrobacteraceae bacterium]
MGAGAAEIFSGPDAGLGLLESGGEIAARSPLQLFWRRIRRDRVAQAAGVFILLLIFVAIFAPLVVKLLGLPSPYTQNPNLTGSFGEPLGPSSGHPFGVDPLGEDVASRVIYGTRVSLEIGLIGTAVATTIGVVLGLVAGYYRGWIDTVISFLINVTLSLPLLLLGL